MNMGGLYPKSKIFGCLECLEKNAHFACGSKVLLRLVSLHVRILSNDTKTHYNFPYDGKWWDNYRQQPIVIVNEFRGDADIRFSEMLSLIDSMPKEVSRRNRAPLPFISRLVIVTCPVGPEKVYGRIDKEDNFAQFARRCVVIELKTQYVSTKTDEEKITEMKSLFKTITGEDAKLFENFG